MRSAHCSFLTIILKRVSGSYSLVLQSLRSHPYAAGRV